MTTTYEIRGYLVGPIWWPAGEECWKPLAYDVTQEEARAGKMTLRDHLLSATLDGDFQSCAVAQGELIARRVVTRAGRTITMTRTWPLESFPSVADMLHDDPDWFPSSPEDFDE